MSFKFWRIHNVQNRWADGAGATLQNAIFYLSFEVDGVSNPPRDAVDGNRILTGPRNGGSFLDPTVIFNRVYDGTNGYHPPYYMGNSSDGTWAQGRRRWVGYEYKAAWRPTHIVLSSASGSTERGRDLRNISLNPAWGAPRGCPPGPGPATTLRFKETRLPFS